MSDKDNKPVDAAAADAPAQQQRRNFLLGLGKWSAAVVAGAVFGGVIQPRDAQAGWINNRGGGGGGWVNGGGGGWINNRGGGGGWLNNR
jgi:hypothetical protein